VKPTYLVLPSPVLRLRVVLQRLCLKPTRSFGKRSTVRSVSFDFYYSLLLLEEGARIPSLFLRVTLHKEIDAHKEINVTFCDLTLQNCILKQLSGILRSDLRRS
jgi:hypothetical protein